MTQESDTPRGEPGELSLDGAAEAFNRMLNPPEPEAEKVDTEVDPPKKKEPAEPAEPDPDGVEEGADAPITLEVDGKQVTLTKAELAEAYKNGLRQGDYTQKTMALAEQRKAAEAETLKAVQERHTYAQNLGKMAAQLEGALEEQSKIDWDALLQTDPVKYLEQQRIFQTRHAQLQQAQSEQRRVAEQNQAEQARAVETNLLAQQEQLLAKLPQWKDPAKAQTERAALTAYLTSNPDATYRPEELEIHDHRAIVLSRKAMLYDQMVAKMNVADKRMQNTPTKVERPGVSTDNSNLDGRTRVMREFNKNPTVDNMAKAFASIL